MKRYLVPALFAGVMVCQGQHDDMASCPMHQQHMKQKGVESRGDHAMGFSHEKTTHHFRLLPDGGAIAVEGNDTKDAASRDQIRMHLTQIAEMFTAGNFETPLFIHGEMPTGVADMKRLREVISYRFEATEQGGRVRITARSPEAIMAVHEFLKFQITDHQTGDPLTTSR
jgi:hypothetical protein